MALRCVLIKAVRNQLVSMYISAWHLHYVFGMEWEELHNSWEEYWAGFPHIDVLMHSHFYSAINVKFSPSSEVTQSNYPVTLKEEEEGRRREPIPE